MWGWGLRKFWDTTNQIRREGLEFELFGEKCNTITTSLGIQGVRRFVKLEFLRLANNNFILASARRGQEILLGGVLKKNRGRCGLGNEFPGVQLRIPGPKCRHIFPPLLLPVFLL